MLAPGNWNPFTNWQSNWIEVLEQAKEIDKDIARINSTAPNGEHDRLLTVECAARGVAVGPNAALSLLTELKLPHWSSAGYSWPPPVPLILPEQVIPAAMLQHPGANWAEELKRRDAERLQESKRVADYHRRQQREKEDSEKRPCPGRTGTASIGVNMNVSICGRSHMQQPSFPGCGHGRAAHCAGGGSNGAALAVEQLTPFRRGRYALVVRLWQAKASDFPAAFTHVHRRAVPVGRCTASNSRPSVAVANPFDGATGTSSSKAGSGLLGLHATGTRHFLVFISLAKGSKDDTSATAFWVKDGREARRLRTQQHASPVRMT